MSGMKKIKKVNDQYNSTQVNLSNQSDIVKYATDNIDKNDIYKVGNEFGIEHESHITVLYGIHKSEKLSKLKDICKELDPIKIKIGKVSFFSNDNFDVLKYDIVSPDLKKVNKLFREKLEYTSTFPYYIPHLTLSYLKPGTAKKYLDLNKFTGYTEIFNNIMFTTGSKSKRIKIPLGTIAENYTYRLYKELL